MKYKDLRDFIKQLEDKDKEIERIVTDSLNATTELLKDNALLRTAVNELGHYFKQHGSEHYDGDKLIALAKLETPNAKT